MPHRSLVRSFVVLWWTIGAVLLVLSVQTALAALVSGDAGRLHVLVLGMVESLAAVLFLIPRTMRIGAVGLLLTLALAFTAHAVRFEFRGDLLVFIAVVTFVAVHGSVRLAWLRTTPMRAA